MSAYGIAMTPVVGGDRDLVVGGADELAGEATCGRRARRAVRTRARRPRKRRKWSGLVSGRSRPGRGDLERVALADLGQQVGDALAEGERDAVGMIDEEAHVWPPSDLGEQHLDIRRASRRAAPRSRSACCSSRSSSPDNKKAGERPLSDCTGRGPAPKAVAAR